MAKTRGREFGWKQVRVGVVLIIGILLLGYAIVRVADVMNLFADRYPLFTVVESASGLQEGSPVHLAGQRVGQITKIRFLPPARRAGEKNLVLTLSIDKDVQAQIRTSSRARILSQGLLGDRYVNIDPGSPPARVLEPGDTVVSVGGATIDDLVTAGATALDSLQMLMSDLRGITRPLAAGEGTLGRLITDEELYFEVVATASDLRATIAQINREDGTLGRLIRDPALYEDLERVVGDIDALTLRISAGEGTLGRLVMTDTLYTELLSAVVGTDSIAESLARITETMVEGRGAFQRLFTDPAMYDQVLKLVVDLQTLVKAIRENPKPFVPPINVEVF